jgi:hypothetical protein
MNNFFYPCYFFSFFSYSNPRTLFEDVIHHKTTSLQKYGQICRLADHDLYFLFVVTLLSLLTWFFFTTAFVVKYQYKVKVFKLVLFHAMKKGFNHNVQITTIKQA